MRLKRVVQKLAYRSGLTAWRGHRGHARLRATTFEIFFGHHVLPDEAEAPDLKVSQLHDRLRYLHRTRDMVSLSEGVEALQRPRGRSRLAALTFDDGYRDNLYSLLPVLRETRTPATIYVSTAPILEGCGLWFDYVRTAVRLSRLTALNVPWLNEQFGDNITLTHTVTERLRRVGPVKRQRLLAELLEAVPAQCRTLLPHQQMLTVPELQQLAADPLITIGAHTHNHTVLSACSDAEAKSDLQENLDVLERLLGQRPEHFAYPNGQQSDFGARDKAMLYDFGITSAVTTIPGLNLPGDEPMTLLRHPLGEGPTDRFAWQIEGGVSR